MDNQFKENLLKNGVVVIPSAIETETINELRQETENEFHKEGDSTLTPSRFLANPKLCQALFHDACLSSIRDCIGKFIIYPNLTVREDLYIGWHTDDRFLNGNPVEDNLSSLGEFIQCNIYLQDSDPIYGGGIDVMLGSHRLNSAEKLKLAEQEPDAEYTTITTQAGDLLLFDYRVVHRSTLPQKQLPRRRYAIQWTVSKGRQFSNQFMAYLLSRRHDKRHPSDYTNKRALKYFNDIPNINQNLLGKNLVEQMRAHGTSMLTADNM